ncbi:MAG: glycosyltransferase family 2 protein [Aphanocapsa sp. GSE-SYN-MK-11-07L]|jgi:cellulose synthase/poly-beta-1,6-N-acetylglucosamine synthase-like glycosyltransferase|nr:glycosyltransferase family 2 protein [Aphanocapsa sp. GSE-SYN-MK-11-07L]
MLAEIPLAFLTQIFLSLLAIALLIPTIVLLVESCSAVFLPDRPSKRDVDWQQIKVAVLMPAHNEALVIESTLQSLLKQVKATDQVVVVADNCEDQTAAIAAAMGATVIARHDPNHRGKGYALDFGLRHLSQQPPDVVVMVDADCQVQSGALPVLAQQAFAVQRPIQAIYLLDQPAQPSQKDLISAFAFKVKNWVRPLGLHKLGLACLLTGTGMAFPWPVICSVDLASGHIVEDMKLGLDLAIAGYPPQFCPEALVLSQLPQDQQVAKGQRTRWEHGHLQVMKTYLPKLLQTAFQQGRPDLFALGLELWIPPLALLVLLWLGMTLLSLLARSVMALWLPIFLLLLTGLFLGLSIILGWAKFGRAELPLIKLIAVPLYILWKIPLYLMSMFNAQKNWNSTRRDIS